MRSSFAIFALKYAIAVPMFANNMRIRIIAVNAPRRAAAAQRNAARCPGDHNGLRLNVKKNPNMMMLGFSFGYAALWSP